MTSQKKHFGIVGSGPSALYLLRHIHERFSDLGKYVDRISIFESGKILGMGMPYNPHTTDRYNMSNISSEELPDLGMSFAQWLRDQGDDALAEWDIRREDIADDTVYCRLALGEYFHGRFLEFISALREKGLRIDEYPECRVDDLIDGPESHSVFISTSDAGIVEVDHVVIATGHSWNGSDRPVQGFYASPWPIFKLLPAAGKFYNFEVGTLGASLSAFDVISSLAHRHGTFFQEDDGLRYEELPGSEGFRIAMHGANGWLPQLQFEQVEPLREIYRHCDREQLLAMRDEAGFLSIDTYFDKICRPALEKAFLYDDRHDLVEKLGEVTFRPLDLIEILSAEHEYRDAFEGMRRELKIAKKKIESGRPIHWKEVIDDLVYCLNFHAELLSAEDHLRLTSVLMPFQMNVIAALPLPSARILLALHDAGILRLIEGRAEVEKSSEGGTTKITVTNGDEEAEMEYSLFVDCSGQKPIQPDQFPFPSLLQQGAVRPARVRFAHAASHQQFAEKGYSKRLLESEADVLYLTGGIDIDAAYHLIGADGVVSSRIFDISIPHIMGVRPYSYGLQACNATAAILVQSWENSCEYGPVESSLDEVSKNYEAL